MERDRPQDNIYLAHNDDGETVMREFQVYTPAQESRLTAFHNMLNRVMDAEQVMREHDEPQHFGVVDPALTKSPRPISGSIAVSLRFWRAGSPKHV